MSGKTLILGAGNLLLGDEGFGVHFIRHLETHYRFPAAVELVDAGTLGLMLTEQFEAADRVYIIDAILAKGQPGECRRFNKEEFLLNRLPLKLSPHQAGVQELLLVSELRGRCPTEVYLLGIIPVTLSPGTELSPAAQQAMRELAVSLAAELGGARVGARTHPTAPNSVRRL